MNNKPKRIVAWVCLITLPLIYIATLVLALCGMDLYHPLLAICIIATIALPIFAYIIIWLLGRYNDKKIIGDPVETDIDDSEEKPV